MAETRLLELLQQQTLLLHAEVEQECLVGDQVDAAFYPDLNKYAGRVEAVSSQWHSGL